MLRLARPSTPWGEIVTALPAPDHDDAPDHGRAKCGMERAGRPPCRLPAGWGTDHPGIGRCKLHLGTTASHRKRAARQIAEAKQAELTGKLLDRLAQGGPVPDVDLAGMWAVNLDIGQTLVEWLRDDVLPEVGALDAAAPSVWLERLAKQVSEQLGALRMASQTGLEERQVAVAESQGRLLAGAVRRILERLGLADDPAALEVARAELLALNATVDATATAIEISGNEAGNEPKDSDLEGGQ